MKKLTKDTLIEGVIYKAGREFSVEGEKLEESVGEAFDEKGLFRLMQNAVETANDNIYDKYFISYYKDGVSRGYYTDDVAGENEAIRDMSDEYTDEWAQKMAVEISNELINTLYDSISTIENRLGLSRIQVSELSNYYKDAFIQAISNNF